MRRAESSGSAILSLPPTFNDDADNVALFGEDEATLCLLLVLLGDMWLGARSPSTCVRLGTPPLLCGRRCGGTGTVLLGARPNILWHLRATAHNQIA